MLKNLVWEALVLKIKPDFKAKGYYYLFVGTRNTRQLTSYEHIPKNN
jgi:hypothetical protein